ncbi:MAG: lipoprotein [Bacteroidia bacterium]|nr:MAG: lipoprotein [Bacteroidia bacterium]
MRNVVFLIGIIFLIVGCKAKKNATISATKSSTYNYVKSTLQLSDKEMHQPLYTFITEWYGVPYKYGECSKNGVDCSGFVNLLYQKVYHKTLERKSEDIFHKQCKKIKHSEVKEGDLVFFKIESKEITHVGVYLKNDKFVHASTKKGVIISDLNEPYFQKYFYAFGRVK